MSQLGYHNINRLILAFEIIMGFCRPDTNFPWLNCWTDYQSLVVKIKQNYTIYSINLWKSSGRNKKHYHKDKINTKSNKHNISHISQSNWHLKVAKGYLAKCCVHNNIHNNYYLNKLNKSKYTDTSSTQNLKKNYQKCRIVWSQ